MKAIDCIFDDEIILTVDKYIVRHVEVFDIDGIYHMYSDEESLKYQGFKPISKITEAYESIKDWIQAKKDHEYLRFSIYDTEDEEVIGLLELRQFDKKNRSAVIGYMLSRYLWKQGITTKVLKVFLPCVFERYNFNFIDASINPMNKASMQISKNLGFSHVDTKSFEVFNHVTGQYEDRYIMRYYREDYKEGEDHG